MLKHVNFPSRHHCATLLLFFCVLGLCHRSAARSEGLLAGVHAADAQPVSSPDGACHDLSRLASPPTKSRAVAELNNSLGTSKSFHVRGRLAVLEAEEQKKLEEGHPRPLDFIRQDELESTSIDLFLQSSDGKKRRLGTFTSDGEGYLDLKIGLQPPSLPRVYALEAQLEGDCIGRASVRLLPENYSGLVVRSDIDMTYLRTNFTGTRDKARLLVEGPEDKKTLPAMDLVYSGLRKGADGEADRPLTFISGSPTFFKGTLEAKILLDKIKQDGIYLKPFKSLIRERLASLRLHRLTSALREQIGYKLSILFRARLDVPWSTREILMGDDTEADAVVYALFYRFLAGKLDAAGLLKTLDEDLKVDRSWLETIEPLATQLRSRLGTPGSQIAAIYINRTGKAGEKYPVQEWGVAGLTRYHEGAWPLVLDLWEEGWVSEETVTAVGKRLLELGADRAELAAAAEAGMDAGFLDSRTLGRRFF